MLRPAEQIKQIIEETRGKLVSEALASMQNPENDESGKVLAKMIMRRETDILDFLLRALQLQDGDEATGLEILAGLSGKEQRNALGGNGCPVKFGLVNSGCDNWLPLKCDDCWWGALRTMYVYHSGKWEVKGEK
jgi:hypothetical protein